MFRTYYCSYYSLTEISDTIQTYSDICLVPSYCHICLMCQKEDKQMDRIDKLTTYQMC